jgi:hypothetical protein
MPEVWKSPRKIEEEIKQYKIDRFERQMQLVDRGDIPRAIALTALAEEFDNLVEMDESSEQNSRV